MFCYLQNHAFLRAVCCDPDCQLHWQPSIILINAFFSLVYLRSLNKLILMESVNLGDAFFYVIIYLAKVSTSNIFHVVLLVDAIIISFAMVNFKFIISSLNNYTICIMFIVSCTLENDCVITSFNPECLRHTD